MRAKPAALVLEDGARFRGTSRGGGEVFGEICFNTSPRATEVINDPS